MTAKKNTQLERLKKVIVPILKRNGVVKAGIFGSVARGEAEKVSDIDVLIEYKGKKSLFDFVDLKLNLEEKLHKRVDLVEYSAIHPILKERILKDEVKIL